MAKFTWQERLAEIEKELAEVDGKPLPGCEESKAFYARKVRDGLLAERAEIVAAPDAWTRSQEAHEARFDAALAGDVFAPPPRGS